MVFLLGVVSLLTFHLHHEGIQAVLSQFQKGQLSYAKHLSNQIRFYIQARARGLRAASSFPSIRSGTTAQQRSDIEGYAKQIETVYVKAVSLLDESGALVYSTDPTRIDFKRNVAELFTWARNSENKDRISLTPVMTETRSLVFILATPLYRGRADPKRPAPNGPFAGVLAFTLDMKEFLADQLGSADPKMELDQVWIMDKDGTLLFQPEHPEMVFRNIYQREGSCRSCHVSFDYTEEILLKRQGTLDYVK